MSELRVNYPNTIFNELKNDSEEFRQIKAIAIGMNTSKKKIKVKF